MSFYTRDDFEGDAQRVFDKLPATVELIYVDRRDELDSSLYPRVLEAGRRGHEVVWEYVDEVFSDDYRYDSAVDVVMSAASEAGLNLRAPYVSLLWDDWSRLVETVLERDVSDGWNSLMQIAARDEVVIGYWVGDGYHDQSSSTLDDLAVTFNFLTPESADESDWLRAVHANGRGRPALLLAVRGDDFLGFMRDIYVASADGGEGSAYVTLLSHDAGVLDTLNGDGWFEHIWGPFGIEVEMTIDEFLGRSWIDNEPGACGTWREVAGLVTLKDRGLLTLRGSWSGGE